MENFSDMNASPEYIAAYVAMREAEKAFTAVTNDYRARKIGDDEYLAARRISKMEEKKFDAALAREAGWE